MRAIVLVLALGCASGSAVVPGAGPSPGVDTGAGPGADSGADTGADTGADPDDGVPPDWTGRYGGAVAMAVPMWTWLVCEGPATLELHPDGAVSGDVDCVSPERGVPFPISVQGGADDMGRVEASTSLLWVFEDGGTATFGGALWGRVDEDGLQLSLETVVTTEDGDPFITVDGTGFLTR